MPSRSPSASTSLSFRSSINSPPPRRFVPARSHQQFSRRSARAILAPSPIVVMRRGRGYPWPLDATHPPTSSPQGVRQARHRRRDVALRGRSGKPSRAKAAIRHARSRRPAGQRRDDPIVVGRHVARARGLGDVGLSARPQSGRVGSGPPPERRHRERRATWWGASPSPSQGGRGVEPEPRAHPIGPTSIATPTTSSRIGYPAPRCPGTSSRSWPGSAGDHDNPPMEPALDEAPAMIRACGTGAERLDVGPAGAADPASSPMAGQFPRRWYRSPTASSPEPRRKSTGSGPRLQEPAERGHRHLGGVLLRAAPPQCSSASCPASRRASRRPRRKPARPSARRPPADSGRSARGPAQGRPSPTRSLGERHEARGVGPREPGPEVDWSIRPPPGPRAPRRRRRRVPRARRSQGLGSRLPIMTWCGA